MDRKFFLHVRPNSPLIEEVKQVVEPFSIFTEGWTPPVRTIPSIQFFPETNELIEGEDAIRAWLETIKPRPMARERKELPPIKTTPPPPPPPTPTPPPPTPNPSPQNPNPNPQTPTPNP